eukprot:3680948-Pleurochrysis_carterae.AAC.1
MAATRALRRILAADHVVVDSVTPQLVKDLDGQQKQRDVAVLSRRGVEVLPSLWYSQVRGIDDH